MPKRVKYRKSQRGSRKGLLRAILESDFGEFGLQTLERAWITNTQLEAARVALTRQHETQGQTVDPHFPDKSVTSRPPERGWEGQGGNRNTGSPRSACNILIELDGFRNRLHAESLRLAADKFRCAQSFSRVTMSGPLKRMKMKEITELTWDELLTKRRDLRRKASTFAYNSRAGSWSSQQITLLRRDMPGWNSAVPARETDRKEVEFAEPRSTIPSPARSPSVRTVLQVRLERVQ